MQKKPIMSPDRGGVAKVKRNSKAAKEKLDKIDSMDNLQQFITSLADLQEKHGIVFDYHYDFCLLRCAKTRQSLASIGSDGAVEPI
jgi:hypothetical protein